LHEYSGSANIANMGAKKAADPPCTMGNLDRESMQTLLNKSVEE